MLTFQLWRQLRQPLVRNPFYWQLSFYHRLHAPQSKRRRRRRGPIGGLLVVLGEMAQLFFGMYALLGLLFILFPLIPVVLVFSGTIIGGTLGYKLSGYISQLHAKARFELLAVTPEGRAGMSWLLCRVFYWRTRFVQQFTNTAMSIASAALSVMLVLGSLGALLALFNSNTLAGTFISYLDNVIPLLLLPVLLQLDVMQSTLQGGLISLMVSQTLHERVSARSLTVSIHVAVQLLSYVAVLLVLLGIRSALLQLGLEQDVLLALLGVLVFFGMREVVLMIAWRLFLARFDVAEDEKQFILAAA